MDEGDGDTFSIYSAGIRFFGQRMSADVVLLLLKEADRVVPWVSFTYKVGG